ncbi:MAG TPA: TerD family protein [Longimicrobium sp.]|jgi:tellurium resistance protein TerD
MAVTLSKGGNVSLSKEAPGLTRCLIGLGWDVRATSGDDYDLDGSVFILGPGDKVRSDADFIFYNQLTGLGGAVEHTGDNRTGVGDGDDEAIKIDLSRIPAEIGKIAFAVTIHDADSKRQNFGQVSNAYIRLVDETTGREVLRFDLSEEASIETAMIFGEIYRHGTDWKFRAVGQGFQGGLGPLARHYGVNIG